MYRDELDILRTKKHEFNEELPNSADENEIERLSEEFYKVCNINIPQEYVEFLRLCVTVWNLMDVSYMGRII